MEKKIRIDISAKELVAHSGNVFLVYTTKIKEEWYRIKFKREVKNNPEKRGLYHIEFDMADCSLEKGKEFVDTETGVVKKFNDILWIGKIAEISEYTPEEYNAISQEKLGGIFG